MTTGKHEPHVCAYCGATFTPRPNGRMQLYCSIECRKKKGRTTYNAHRRASCQKAAKLRTAQKAAAPKSACLPDVAGRLASTSELMRATKRPRNCSPIRWRIELRRRAKAEYFKIAGMAV